MKNYVEDKKFTTITLENGKTVKAETAYLHNIMKGLEVDMDEAVEIFLEDEGYEVNEEQEELCAKAKDVKVDHGVSVKKRTETTKRTVAANPTKEMIIAEIANTIKGIAAASNMVVENKGKIITFSMNGEDFKIDLIQRRKKKGE